MSEQDKITLSFLDRAFDNLNEIHACITTLNFSSLDGVFISVWLNSSTLFDHCGFKQVLGLKACGAIAATVVATLPKNRHIQIDWYTLRYTPKR